MTFVLAFLIGLTLLAFTLRDPTQEGDNSPIRGSDGKDTRQEPC